MNCEILRLHICFSICFIIFCATLTGQIAPLGPPFERNDYIATFGNRYENPRGRWHLAKKLSKAGQYDELCDICENAYKRAGLGFVYVDKARLHIGFLKFREPEYRSMIADVLVCEIENTESREGLKAQFFLTKGKSDDAVYFLYPTDLGQMKFMVMTERHVTRVVKTPGYFNVSRLSNPGRSFYYKL